MEVAEIPERDLFLMGDLNEETASDIIKGIIKVNVFDGEQESKLANYERRPIRLHICTPRRYVDSSFRYMRPNQM